MRPIRFGAMVEKGKKFVLIPKFSLFSKQIFFFTQLLEPDVADNDLSYTRPFGFRHALIAGGSIEWLAAIRIFRLQQEYSKTRFSILLITLDGTKIFA